MSGTPAGPHSSGLQEGSTLTSSFLLSLTGSWSNDSIGALSSHNSDLDALQDIAAPTPGQCPTEKVRMMLGPNQVEESALVKVRYQLPLTTALGPERNVDSGLP